MQSAVAKRPVSMKDVAEHMGVSKATISRALSGKSEIPLRTRKKINKACEQLGYRLNTNIQDLIMKSRSGITRNIGFVLVGRDFSDPAYAAMIDGIAQGLKEIQYNLILVKLEGNESSVYDLPPLLRDERIDGILLAGRVPAQVMTALKKLNVEIMAFGTFSPAALKGVNNIQVNVEKMAYESIELAMQAGHHKLALFEEAPKTPFYLQSYSYIKAAAEKYGLEFREENFYQGSGPYSGATKIMKPVLKQKELSFDCIICWDFRTAEELSALIMGRCGLDNEPDVQIVVSRPYPHFNLPIPALYLNTDIGHVALIAIEYLIDRIKSNVKQIEPIRIQV